MKLPENVVPMPAEQRAELTYLAQQATPGPWKVAPTGHVYTGDGRAPLHVVWLLKDNCRYIAAVSPDITLATLAYVEALEAENVTLRTRLAEEQAATAEQEVELLRFANENMTLRKRELQRLVPAAPEWFPAALQAVRASLAARKSTADPAQLHVGTAYLLQVFLEQHVESVSPPCGGDCQTCDAGFAVLTPGAGEDNKRFGVPTPDCGDKGFFGVGLQGEPGAWGTFDFSLPPNYLPGPHDVAGGRPCSLALPGDTSTAQISQDEGATWEDYTNPHPISANYVLIRFRQKPTPAKP